MSRERGSFCGFRWSLRECLGHHGLNFRGEHTCVRSRGHRGAHAARCGLTSDGQQSLPFAEDRVR